MFAEQLIEEYHNSRISTKMTTDWLLRCSDGGNFKRSSKHGIWGIQTTKNRNGVHFINNVKPGDRLWFIKSNSRGKIIAVATYRSNNKREIGPLLDITMTNQELGWYGSGTKWTADTEVHYTNLYGLNKCELLTHIKGNASIRRFNEKCRVNLPVEYSNIMRYSKVTFKL